ncbi:ubiquitin-conjugating enzyme E2 C-like isoform X2 [Macrotis lagotis]|uniref:ubiquitin-conjugating enzyme E2 C-like isoform X2 n=1 Tax=Macrotis lagotis TaxID=92651 RepID=UPI003D692BFD
MVSQNWDWVSASTTATSHKGTEHGTGAACGSVGKRLQQELMTKMVYEELRYKLSLEVPSGYPYNALTVKFVTYHPDVDMQGNNCLDILKDKGSALYDVRTILLFIQSLVGEFKIDCPLNTHAAELWTNPIAFKKDLLETYIKQMTSQKP